MKLRRWQLIVAGLCIILLLAFLSWRSYTTPPPSSPSVDQVQELVIDSLMTENSELTVDDDGFTIFIPNE